MTALPPVIKINDTRTSFPPIVKVNNKVFKVKG
jgi:hypothetical protein